MYRWREVKDKIFVAIVIGLSLAALLPLFHMMLTVIVRGLPVIMRAGLRFITEPPPPPISGDVGGVAPALYGSLLVVGLSLPITIVLALLLAILTVEFPWHPLSKIGDALARSFASIPTIIVSMVTYALVVVPLGRPSALAGAVALSIVSIPYAYTAFYSALSAVPHTYREASYSIGMTKWKFIVKILMPIARKGLTVGILMTLARAMGETAALLFTVGSFRTRISISVTEPTDAMPLLIFEFMATPFRAYHEMAWGAAFMLLIIYLAIFFVAKVAVKEVKL